MLRMVGDGVQELVELARPLLTPSEDISNVSGFRVSESTWIPREEVGLIMLLTSN